MTFPDAGNAPTRAVIDLSSLRHNYRLLKRRAGAVPLFGVVKANAYGHGAVDVSKALVEEGAAGLAVATVDEGVELRNAGIANRILVFGAPRRPSIGLCVEHHLEPFLTSTGSLDVIRGTGPLDVHVHVDTGMGRLGIEPGDLARTLLEMERMPGVRTVGISTHFANSGMPADTFSSVQWERFMDAVGALGDPPAPLHLASTSAMFTIPESVDDRLIGYARPGIGLYGLLDLSPELLPEPMRPVMTLVSEVAHVKHVPTDTPISYDGRWRAHRETRIATISAGYADGYPRLLTNRASVNIRGSRFPIAGTICMDLTMVDLGPAGGPGDLVETGDAVVLFGAGGPSAIELASLAETIAYELVCGVGNRVPRVYVNRERDRVPSQ